MTLVLRTDGRAPARRALRRWLPVLLVAPSVVLLLLLIAYPLLFALKNSFTFWNLQMGPNPMGFVGLDNFRQVLTSADFLASLRNTIVLSVVGVSIEFCLGLAIALLLTHALPGMSAARALLILPTTIAPIVVGFLFRYLYDPTAGLIPWTLKSLFVPVPPQGLLGNQATALASIILADVWQWTPFFAIVLYAGLLSVPEEIVEAARLDGASRWTMLVRIKLPLIWRTAAIVLMLRFMQLFNTFDPVLVLTRGGPGTSSRTLGYSLYEIGLVHFNIGLASAMTWVIVVIVNALIALYVFFVFRKEEW
jgi:multiple sugar transport system permease protein